MKRYLTFLLLLSMTVSYSQEVFIVVYKGEVKLEGKKLIPRTKYEIPIQKAVTYGDHSKFIILSKSKYYNFNEASANAISYAEIIKKLNQNASRNFLKLMSAYHVIRHVESDAIGSGRASGKGLNDKIDAQLVAAEEPIFPQDSARTSAKSIELSWELKNNIMGGKLYVIHEQTKDTLYAGPATAKGKANINLEKLGRYNWFIYSKMDKKKRINQSFIRQTEEENTKMLNDFAAFRKEIALMDEEFQAMLIEEYKLKYGIIE